MPYVIDAPYTITSSPAPLSNVSSSTTTSHGDLSAINGSQLSVDDVLYLTINPVFIAGRYIHFLWYCIGFVGNVIAAILWLQPNLYDVCSSAHYLFSIAICDIICQFLHVFYYLRIFWRVQAFDNLALCEFWSLVYMIPQYVGQLLVVGYTIDILISINKPFSGGSFESQNRATRTIIWIVITVTVMVFPQAYFWEGYCNVIRKNVYPIWNWLTVMVVYIITPIITFILNLRILYIFRNPQKFLPLGNQQKEFVNHLIEKFKASFRESITTFVSLSFFRVISLLPDTLMRCLLTLDYFESAKLEDDPVYSIEDVEKSERWQKYIRFSAARYSIGFVSYSYLAMSIVVYCVTSPTFRNDLRSKIRRIQMAFMTFAREKYKQIRTFYENFRENED